MKLEKIKELYPKGFQIFYKWWQNIPSYKDRDLYDFFDSVGIQMSLLPCSEMKIASVVRYNKQQLIGETNYDFLQQWYGVWAIDRTEAEEAGFEKCFEILERELQ